MAKSRKTKKEEIQALIDASQGAKGIVFASFAGLSVAAVSDLRRRCSKAGVHYIVSKKTLLKIAFERAGIDAIDPKTLSGGIATVFGGDEVVAAKLLHDFAKDHEALQFVGGLLPKGAGWEVIVADQVKQLAKLPSKQELIGQLVGMLAAPMRGFVTVLSGPSRAFVQVLAAIQESKA
ncbi:MAG: 50S ribosomal protein L10 [Patescibacteria group bacterium]|jgi:large subunit ribosomal protein L10